MLTISMAALDFAVLKVLKKCY